MISNASPISAITQTETRIMSVTVILSILPICIVRILSFVFNSNSYYDYTENEADHQPDDKRDHRSHGITSTKGKPPGSP